MKSVGIVGIAGRIARKREAGTGGEAKVGTPLGWRLRDASKEGAGMTAEFSTGVSGASRDPFGRSGGTDSFARGLGWIMLALASEKLAFGGIDIPLAICTR